MVEFVVMALICLGMFYSINKDSKDDTMPEPENPAEFKSALVFGLLYGAILLAVAFANEEFGDDALYIVAIISGLTDVDAITLSLSQLIKIDALNVSTGWKLILLASLSNLVFKGVMAGILGTKQLAKWIALSFGIAIIVGIFLIWLWPASWHL